MKIESRVEALEQELKILKNEIQSTLLEIREQVLNHYYPELRADETQKANSSTGKQGETRTSEVRASEIRPGKNGSSRSNGNPRAQDIASLSLSAPAEKKAQIQPFSDIFLQDMDIDLEDEDDELERAYPEAEMQDDDINTKIEEMEEFVAPSRSASFAPQMREVGLQQLKQAASAPMPKINPSGERGERAELPQAKASQPKPSRRNFALLATWVGDSVASVGKERTIQVVETYAGSGGEIAPETKSAILQLVSLADDVEPAAPVSNQAMMGLMIGLDQILNES
jgi:hypothetical protein